MEQIAGAAILNPDSPIPQFEAVLLTPCHSCGDPFVTPLPGALPLFATGLVGLGLHGWRRKKKTAPLDV
jgi:hypothetical protein